MSYLAPNYIFNDRDNEQIGMLLVDEMIGVGQNPDKKDEIIGYQVRVMKGTDREQDRIDNRYFYDSRTNLEAPPRSIYLGKDKDGKRISLKADGTLEDTKF